MAQPPWPDRQLRAALKYAAIGWRVFPLATRGDIKAPHPMLGKKEGHRQATLDPERIREWWGRSPNAGIGVWLAGSGLIALDIDPRHGGDAQIAALEAERGRLGTPVVGLTGGGGWHRVFAAPPGSVRPPGHLQGQPGIDIKYNGYIVVPPSNHPSGKRYRWDRGADPFNNHTFMPVIADWALEYRPGVGRGQELNGHRVSDDVFAGDAPKCGLSLAKLRDHLFKVPNNDTVIKTYDDWLKICMAVYHETDGSPEGRELALEWSELNFKHDINEFDKKWPSLDIENKGREPVTFRHVMRLAKTQTRESAVKAVADFRLRFSLAVDRTEFDSLCEEVKITDLGHLDRKALAKDAQDAFQRIRNVKLPIGDARSLVRYENQSIADMPDWLKGWVFCTEENGFYRISTKATLKPAAFNGQFNIKLLSPTDRLEGRVVPEFTAADVALNRYDIPRVRGRRYLPGEPLLFTLDGEDFVNTYTDSRQPEVPETLTSVDIYNIGLIERHFQHLIPDDRERDLAISWFAYIIQTLKRPTWALCLQGPEGDGKTVLVVLMGAVLGASNVRVIHGNHIINSHFTGWAEGHLIKCIDEIKIPGQSRYDILNTLKPLITNNVIEIHHKNIDPYETINTAGYMITTNSMDALPVDAQDSRFFLLASPRQTRQAVVDYEQQNPTYFPELYAAIDASAGAIRRWLLNYPLSAEFNPSARAPASEEHAHAAALSKSEIESEIEDALELGRHDICSELVDMDELRDVLSSNGSPIPMTTAMQRTMIHLGFRLLGRFRRTGSSKENKRQFWTHNPNRFKGNTQAAIRQWLAGAGDL